MARHHWTLKLLTCWIIGLSIAYSALSIIRHNHFQSGGFDLGLYDQAVWQYANFQWPYNTVKERFILGDHLTLTLPLLAPLYWLWSDVRMLLIFQAFWVSISSLAIYKLALHRKLYQFTALVVSIGYSLFYGFQYLIFFDFHPVAIGVGFLAWIAYFIESGKTRWLIASVVLLLLSQENMGLALAGLGCIYVFYKKHRSVAIAFIIGGVGYSFLASRVISWFSPVGFQYWPHLSFDPRVIMQRFFDSYEKRQVWWYSLASFSFLPILSSGAMAAIVFDLAQYFVTGPEFSRMWSPFMHHRATLGVFLTLGVLDAIVLLKRWNITPQRVAILLLASTLALQYVWHLPLNKLTKREYWKEETWMADNRALVALVPTGAAIAAQQNLVPHLSHRKEIYLVYPRPHDYDDNRCGQRSCWWLDFNTAANYLVADFRPDQWLTQILETNEHWQEAVRNMEKSGRITLMKNIGLARLYKVNK